MVLLTLIAMAVPAAAAGSNAVNGIIPATGLNTTIIAITDLAGTNFLSDATVMLTPVNIHLVHKGSTTNGSGGALLNNPLGVFVSGNFAYVASSDSNALEIVDVSDPTNPTHGGRLLDGGGLAPFLTDPVSIFVSGNYTFIASYTSNALEIVDVSDPTNPIHLGSITNGSGGALLNHPSSVFVSGNNAYVASVGCNALEIVDISDPANPTHRGSLLDGMGFAPFLNNPQSVFVSGNYAYVASYSSNALEVVDVSDPTNPTHLGSLVDGMGFAPCLASSYHVFVSGNYAYVTSVGSNALEIVDVSDPTNPVHAGHLDDGGGIPPYLNNPQSVFVSGNYAYVASYSSNALEVVDVSDPTNPTHLGSITNGSGGALLDHPSSVFVSSNHAFVASSDSDALEIVKTGTITASGVSVVSSTKIMCSFNLTGAAPGVYNVVVTNPDGSFGTLSGGFTVIGYTPTPTATPTSTPTPTSTLPTHTPTLTSMQSDSSGSDSDPTPGPTRAPRITITVNVGGDSSVNRANVTGTGLSGLIITGTVASRAGQGISPLPGIVYEYTDLLPARYTTIEKAVIFFTVPQSWLNENHRDPQNIVVYYLTNSTWTPLPTYLVKSETGRSYYTVLSPGLKRFAITADINNSSVQPVQSPEPKHQTEGDMVLATATPPVISTPIALIATESPAQPATQPTSGYSPMTIFGAGVVGVIVLIGLAMVMRRRKSDL